MLDQLFSNAGTTGVLSQHQSAPFLDERIKFLEIRSRDGHDRLRLQNIARVICWAAQSFSDNILKKRLVNLTQIKTAGAKWFQRKSRCRKKRNKRRYLKLFQFEVSLWLRSMNLLDEGTKKHDPYHKILHEYLEEMEHDRGYSWDTIHNKRKIITRLLSWYFSKKRCITAIRIADIDDFIAQLSARGYCRRSLAAVTAELRVFFRYAKNHGWCQHVNPDAIIGPKVYRGESIPAGPSWQDVKRLLASADTDRQVDIRDLPILMLFATYGLRAFEVANLRLDDLDWKKSLIRIRHAKNRRTQWFPLIPTVGNAILRYLRTCRPSCAYHEVFMKLTPPIGPVSRGSLHHVVKGRMIKLGIRNLHRGPHSLRHACAAHLLAEGFSLKEVGDQLGHSSAESTFTYAKVDLKQLRIVADFNFGGVL